MVVEKKQKTTADRDAETEQQLRQAAEEAKKKKEQERLDRVQRAEFAKLRGGGPRAVVRRIKRRTGFVRVHGHPCFFLRQFKETKLDYRARGKHAKKSKEEDDKQDDNFVEQTRVRKTDQAHARTHDAWTHIRTHGCTRAWTDGQA